MKNDTIMRILSTILMCVTVLLMLSCGEDEPVCTTVGAPCDDGNADTYNDVFNSDCECTGTLNMFVDIRDGQSYNTVKIGTQTWMKENVNFITATSVCPDGIIDNCGIYGRMYHGAEAKTVCPIGWHLPSATEWTLLVDFLGGPATAGGKLKEAGEQHWLAPNTDATNESGFTGLPAGFYNAGGGTYGNLGEVGFWWSSTDDPPDDQWLMALGFNTPNAEMDHDETYAFGLSVRCVRD